MFSLYSVRNILVGLVLSFSFFSFGYIAPAFAACNGFEANSDDPYGIDCGEGTNLTDEDPRVLAARLINVILRLTGLVLVVFIVYAGYLWMTSVGDEEQITKAKNIISSCAIGLLIVLSAYSISYFVISKLVESTR
jgi:cytochrome bd-type quinol oxidase subunit 2